MKNFNELLELADILLGEGGCPWDREQTFDTLKKYLIEEAREVIEAIDSKDWDNLKEELGDVLYNIIFIAKLAEYNNIFNINEVIDGIHKKIIRRHPHIFEDKKNISSSEVKKLWNEIKIEEKKKGK